MYTGYKELREALEMGNLEIQLDISLTPNRLLAKTEENSFDKPSSLHYNRIVDSCVDCIGLDAT